MLFNTKKMFWAVVMGMLSTGAHTVAETSPSSSGAGGNTTTTAIIALDTSFLQAGDERLHRVGGADVSPGGAGDAAAGVPRRITLTAGDATVQTFVGYFLEDTYDFLQRMHKQKEHRDAGAAPSDFNVEKNAVDFFNNEKPYRTSSLILEPESFNDAMSVEKKIAIENWLQDPDRLEKNRKPRLELRAIVYTKTTTPPKVGPDDQLSNIAMCYANGEERKQKKGRFVGTAKDKFSIVMGGSTTLEIGTLGVNKGTAINYLYYHLVRKHDEPDSFSQARHEFVHQGEALGGKKHTDGTMWGKPSDAVPPAFRSLRNAGAPDFESMADIPGSPGPGAVRHAIKEYLRAGGIYMIISGNDPFRTILRFVGGVDASGKPIEFKEEAADASKPDIIGEGWWTENWDGNGPIRIFGQWFFPSSSRAVTEQLQIG